MSEQKSTVEQLIKRIENYINTTLELFKLKAAKSISEMMASIFLWAIVSLIFLLALMVLSISLSIVLSQYLGSAWQGFALVGSFYLLAAVLIAFVFPSSIRRGILNILLKIIFRK